MAATLRPDFTDRVYADTQTGTLDEQLRRLTDWAELEAGRARHVAMHDDVAAILRADITDAAVVARVATTIAQKYAPAPDLHVACDNPICACNFGAPQ